MIFFQKLGMFPMTGNFCEKSIFEKKNKNMVFHASAWDFKLGSDMGANGRNGDFRIDQRT